MTERWPAIVALVTELLALAVAFGVDLTEVQTAAVIATVVAVGGLFVHRRVSPVPPSERGF